jgi:hypothetical protein
MFVECECEREKFMREREKMKNLIQFATADAVFSSSNEKPKIYFQSCCSFSRDWIQTSDCASVRLNNFCEKFREFR